MMDDVQLSCEIFVWAPNLSIDRDRADTDPQMMDEFTVVSNDVKTL